MTDLFATNAPDPHHWTLNSCSVAFRKAWVHLGSFHYCTKLGAKWAELVQLMQKFMPWSRVRTFHYGLTRYTPWDPKLIFLLHFVMFGCIYNYFVATLNSVQMGQSGEINAKVRATKSHMNLSLRMRPIHTIGPKTQVLVCLVMFGCTWDRFATALNLVQNGPYWCNWCKSSCHEVASELFATNARETHHGTQNSYFVPYRKVWVH